jgi:ssDNA-binding replication factor A large subunit
MVDEIQVADVRPTSSNFNLIVKVHSVGPGNEIQDRSGMGRPPSRLAEAVVGDASANVILSLWNQETERLQAGDVVHVRQGYAKLVRGQIRVNTSRDGGLDIIDQEVQADPEKTNISDARHGDDRPPRSRGGPRQGSRPPREWQDRDRRDARPRNNRDWR